MFAVNDVVESLTENSLFGKPARILWISDSESFATLITIAHPPKCPWAIDLDELKLLFKAGAVRITSMRVPPYMLEIEETLSEQQKRIRQTSWDRIQPLIETSLPGQVYQEGALGALVAARAKNCGVPRKLIYRLLCRYWLFGMTKNAFLPKYSNCGARGQSRKFINGKTPGRPRMYLGERAPVGPKVLSDEDKSLIKIGYALYHASEVKTLVDAYTKMLNRFYRKQLPAPDEPDDFIELKPLAELPSPTQFRYWGKKAFDEISTLRSRSGERNWNMNHRALRGRSYDRLHGPCHRFEVDATIADIYLISRFNRNWIIGRPVVYVVVDVFSRMIAGIFVGLEGPSWNGARQALFNAFSDKVAYCASFGITIRPEQWPCFHLPQELVADRAEMLGSCAEGVVTGLDINLAIMPPFRPDWKAIVESRFRILNQLTQIHWAPGGVLARVKERGERDYRLDATLNLHEFTSILIKSALHYNQHSLDPDRLSSAMIAQEVGSAPLNIWNWGIDQGLGEPNIRSPDEVYLHLLPHAQATIQAGGIHFNGMFYKDNLYPEGERAARARSKGREKINVWYEPGSVNDIWIQGPDKSFIQCPLRSSETRFRDRRLEEVQDMLAITHAKSSESLYAELNSKVNLDEFIETKIRTAKNEKEELDRPASKAQAVAAIRENRDFERSAERIMAAERSPLPKASQPNEKQAPSSTNAVAREYAGERGAEVIDMLKRLHQKRARP